MFIISSVPEKYVGEVIVTCGTQKHIQRVCKTIFNMPINPHHVATLKYSDGEIAEGVEKYQIIFHLINGTTERWTYLNEDDRDNDYLNVLQVTNSVSLADLRKIKENTE